MRRKDSIPLSEEDLFWNQNLNYFPLKSFGNRYDLLVCMFDENIDILRGYLNPVKVRIERIYGKKIFSC